jgi:hypothetical protein
VSFVAITLCVASQRVCIVVSVYFVINSARNLFDTLSYVLTHNCLLSFPLSGVLKHTFLFTMYVALLLSKSQLINLKIKICSRVRFRAGAVNFSLHRRIQNGSGAHPASYLMDTGGSFPGGKAAEA